MFKLVHHTLLQSLLRYVFRVPFPLCYLWTVKIDASTHPRAYFGNLPLRLYIRSYGGEAMNTYINIFFTHHMHWDHGMSPIYIYTLIRVTISTPITWHKSTLRYPCQHSIYFLYIHYLGYLQVQGEWWRSQKFHLVYLQLVLLLLLSITPSFFLTG